ncbi:hypothetical protein [Salinisphaera hydrothermalis]|uniref:hypothetical protein n=1 Tax=Salinisphaera hydrothermalis TaxID=563188 RepID=UPI003340939D
MALGGAAAGALGSKGGQSKTQTSTQKTELPSWLNDASKSAISLASDLSNRQYDPAAAQNAYGINDAQRSAIQRAQSLGTTYQPYLHQAADALGNTNQDLTGADISSYMNPYTQNVTDVAANNMVNQFAQQQNARNENAAQAGAFGGLRAELGNQDAAKQYLTSIGNLYSSNLGNAYNSGVANWQADRANQSNLASQYGNLAGTSGGLAAQGVNEALQAGGVQQQSGENLYRSNLDFGQKYQLSPLLQAVSTVPHNTTTTSTGTMQQQNNNSTLGSAVQGGIGGLASAYGMGLFGG